MAEDYDERIEQVERKEGYYWNVSVQLGKTGERVKVKEGGNADSHIESMDQVKDALGNAVSQAREGHEKITEEG